MPPNLMHSTVLSPLGTPFTSSLFADGCCLSALLARDIAQF